MKRKSCFVVAFLVVLVLMTAASASSLLNFNITRIAQYDNKTYAYVDIFDVQDNRPITADSQNAFSATIDGTEVPVAAYQTMDATGRGIHYIIVPDVSRNTSESWPKAKEGLQAIIQGMNSADTVSIVVSKRDGAAILCQEESNVQTALNALNEIKIPNASGNSLYYDAMNLALTIAKQSNTDLKYNVIVGYIYTSAVDKSSTLSANELKVSLDDNQVPFYLVGYGKAGIVDDLAQVSRSSGGTYFYTDNIKNITSLLGQLQRRIKGSYLVELKTDALNKDIKGQVRLEMVYSSVKSARTAVLNLTAAATSVPTSVPVVAGQPTIAPKTAITVRPGSTSLITASPTPTAFATLEPEVEESTGNSLVLFAGIGVMLLIIVVLVLVVLRKNAQKKSIQDVSISYEDLSQTTFDATVKNLDETLPAFGSNVDLDKTMVSSAPAGGLFVTFDISVFDSDGGKLVETLQEKRLVKNPIIIGRAKTADIVVPSPTVSKNHVELMSSDGQLLIRDIGRTNPCVVDGQRIEDAVALNNGSVIELGWAKIKVTF